jgi:hypothetical protein
LSDPKHGKIGDIIKAKAGTDYVKFENLWSAYSDILKSQQVGISPATKLMLGLGVSDGARATAMFSAMHANPDAASNLYKSWLLSGALTDDVIMQLSRLDREAVPAPRR